MTSARLTALVLVALVLGTSFCHVLEMPAKLTYDDRLYLTLQTSLYAYFGPPGPGGYVEPVAIVAVGAVAALVRRRRPAFALTVASGVCLLLAFPVIYFLLTEPANAAFRASLESGQPPLEWQRLRVIWEASHTARFACHFLAFLLLAWSVARETRYDASSPVLGDGPPSMISVAPLMNAAADEARNTQG